MLRGDVGLAFDTIATSAGFIRDGALRAIAVTSAHRSPAMPDVPTVAESGLPGYEAVFWNGVFAPARTPPEVIARLNQEIDFSVRLQEVIDRVQEWVPDPQVGHPMSWHSAFRQTSTPGSKSSDRLA